MLGPADNGIEMTCSRLRLGLQRTDVFGEDFWGFLGILDLVLPSRPTITVLAMIVEGDFAGDGANGEGV